jgi:excisionase family DNA binding protein
VSQHGATLDRVAEDDKVLTVEEVAERMRVNPETVRRWLRTKQLRGVRMNTGRGGGAYRILESELLRFQRGD